MKQMNNESNWKKARIIKTIKRTKQGDELIHAMELQSDSIIAIKTIAIRFDKQQVHLYFDSITSFHPSATHPKFPYSLGN